jgi:CRISPR/Cas system-associated endonuclease/helicase Cas3
MIQDNNKIQDDTQSLQMAVSDSAISDVFENLFTDKYSKKYKLDLLSKCESNGSLKLFIKKHQPKYYIEHRDMVMTITLAKDLGFV